MASNTFTLIASSTVGAGGTASVILGSGGTIPQTYTDLILYSSARSTFAASGDNLYYKINAYTTGYSQRFLYGTGSVAGSASATDPGLEDYSVGNNATANTFSNVMLYMPNYTSSVAKSISVDSVSENNATASNMGFWAELLNQTGAITSITITSGNGGNLAQYSSFYLYGVKNA